MVFPAGYYGLALPSLMFQYLAFTLYYIKTVICWAIHLVGLAESGEPADSSSWQHFPDIMNYPAVNPSISADTFRDSLPVVTFRKFPERFSESMGDDLMCAVCLSSFEEEDHVTELCDCRHIFHRSCLDKWLDHRQTTCPLCRSSLLPEKILDTGITKSWFLDRIAYIFGEDLAISS